MDDLSRDRRRDRIAAWELQRAQIDVIPVHRAAGGLASRPRGKLGPIQFTRGPSYWIADGPVPIAVAQIVYAHPIGRRDVRVGGSPDRPPPQAPWVAWYTTRGERVYPVAYEAGIRNTFEQWPELVRNAGSIVFHDDPVRIGAAGYVDLLHIDSADGLQVFSSTLRTHRIDEEVRPAWWALHARARSNDRMARLELLGTCAQSATGGTWDGDTQPMAPEDD